ncbi:pickpocket protein 28-like [Pseudomyrmex gracilis]|uniref:pickpocket protein 28-like n=1 Tax=Pseudomyrmex gracilis TaxID=219809 RepID=UPI0009956DDB|nr:pickpocket protein 28-like [Pseudomyrmex gracilis]
MEDLSLRERGKTKSNFNPWNDARILTHVIANNGRTVDLSHLRINETDAMPTRSYDRNTVDVANENYYNTSDKPPSFDYLKIANPVLPYSINTVHLQNPYRPLQRLEGFVSRDNTKGMYKSQDFVLRSRYNNLFPKKELNPNRDSDHENEKVERLKKKKPQVVNEFYNLLRQYCANTSLHGLRYVGDSELSLVERIFWIISFITVLATAIYYSCYLYDKWHGAPIIISLSPEPIALNEFPFPSVTICNMNKVRKTEAMRIERGSDMREKLLMEDVCNTENNITYEEQEAIEWDAVFQFMLNVSQPCTDMLYYCVWHGNQTDCEKIFNPTLTDEGMCCNFNAVDKKYLFYNARDWPILNISYPSESVDWNAEKGYTSSMMPDVVPWRPYGAGLYYGLTLVLDVDVNEYYCSTTAGAGFKMLLHSPVETPKIADFSFAITPGEETRVIIRPRISTANPTIVSIPQRKRKCFFSAERKLRYYRTYTQRNCILECEANFTQQMCHCVQYYMPKSKNTPICSKKDEQCAKLARRTMENKLYDETEGNPLNVTIPSCNCWPGCYEINYRLELSQNKLLSSFNTEKRYVKKDLKYFTKNIAVVHLFFVDSQFTKYVKNELFGFIDFLSSTGGLLGLFMGFSFLSVMEIVYFLTIRLVSRWYNARRKPHKFTAHHKTHLPDDSKKVIYPFTN